MGTIIRTFVAVLRHQRVHGSRSYLGRTHTTALQLGIIIKYSHASTRFTFLYCSTENEIHRGIDSREKYLITTITIKA